MRLTARSALIGILVFSTCVYGMSLRNDFVNLDDPMLVTENRHVQEPSLANIGYVFTHFDPELYVPITLLSYQLETWTLGSDAWHFHLVSLLLHLACVWLAYKIIRLYARSTPVALVTALLFAVHPINSETVLWVSARKDILSATFFLASLLSFLLYKEKASARLYWLSVTLFALALMSKVTVITLPFLLILLPDRPKEPKRWLHMIGPFLLMAAIFGMIALVGKDVALEQWKFTDFLAMAPRSAFFYLSLIIAPTGQSVVHVLNSHEVYSPLLLISIGSIGLLSWVLIRHRKKLPHEFAGWIFFLATLAPTFFHYTRGYEHLVLGSERYMYLPSIGIFFIIASFAMKVWNLSLLTKPTRIILSVASLLIVLILGYLTVLRTFVFQDAVIFNIDTLQKNPEDGRTWYNLATALESHKRPMEAEEAYIKALNVKPDFADAAINLGILFLKEGRTDEGMTMLKHATVIRPDYFKGYFNLGVAHQNAKNFSESEAMYRKTVELFPDYPEARKNLATVLGAQKKFQEALLEYEILADLDPTFRTEYERIKNK